MVGRPSRWEWGAVLVAVAAGATLRFATIGSEGLWLDESVSVLLARLPWSDALEAFRADKMAPLYPCLLRIWIAIFGSGETAVRSLTAVVGTGTIPVLWWLGRSLHSRACGLWAAWIFVFSPLGIHYAQEARPYALMMPVVAAAVLVGFRLRFSPSWRKAAWFACLLCLLPLLHYVGTVLVAMLVVAMIVPAPGPGVVKRALAGGALAFLVWAAWALIAPEPLLEARARSNVAPEGFVVTRAVRTFAACTPGTELPVRNRVRQLPRHALASALLCAGLLFWGMLRWPPPHRREAWMFFLGVPFGYLAMLYVAELSVVELWIVGRTDSMLVVLVVTGVAAGVACLPRVGQAGAGIALLLLAMPGLVHHYRTDFRSQERLLAEGILRQALPGDLVLVTSKWTPTMRYYFDRAEESPPLHTWPPGYENRPLNPGWERALFPPGPEEIAHRTAGELRESEFFRIWLVLDPAPEFHVLSAALGDDWEVGEIYAAPPPLPVRILLLERPTTPAPPPTP